MREMIRKLNLLSYNRRSIVTKTWNNIDNIDNTDSDNDFIDIILNKGDDIEPKKVNCLLPPKSNLLDNSESSLDKIYDDNDNKINIIYIKYH